MCTTNSFTERGYPKYLQDLAAHVHQPTLALLLRRFLHAEVHGQPADPVPLDACPTFEGPITVHHSAIARFYAPSDLGGACQGNPPFARLRPPSTPLRRSLRSSDSADVLRSAEPSRCCLAFGMRSCA
ncbi:hypothetical protein C8R47DRAFT_989839 [Mycena vitilis]|nr:hypothetical protein C8R47DRAFT_989839 [Mycena vitilis]